jgi:hypothetical protein
MTWGKMGEIENNTAGINPAVYDYRKLRITLCRQPSGYRL